MKGYRREFLVTAITGATLGLAGCVGGDNEATPAPDLASKGTTCEENYRVTFWGLTGPNPQWEPDIVRVGYPLPARTSVFLVAYVDGEIAGVEHVENEGDDAAIDDGGRVELDEELTDEHLLQVVVHQDAGGNGEFEADVDRPCLDDGDVVQAGPRRIDFGRFP